MDTADPVQKPRNPQEVDAFFHDDDDDDDDDSSSLEDLTVSSSSAQAQPPATSDIALFSPPPERSVPLSPAIPPPSASAPGPDSDDDEEEMPDLYIPALIAPTMFLPIPNVRLLCSFESVLIWRPLKEVLSDFYTLDRPFVYVTEQIYRTREETC